MRNRNAWGLATLLLLIAAVFGGSLLCQPASERESLPPESAAWRETPAATSARPEIGAEAPETPQREGVESPPPPSVRELSVRVVDDAGAPVLGAEIFLHWAGEPGAAPAARAFADLDGGALFRALPDAEYRVIATAAGFFPHPGPITARIPSPQRPELTITLRRGGVLSGFVHGLDGAEERFAWLRLRSLESGEIRRIRADERGAFHSGPLEGGGWEIAWIEHEQAEPDPRVLWATLVETGARIELLVTTPRAVAGEPKPERGPGIVPMQRGY